jgi:hypothetical protein
MGNDASRVFRLASEDWEDLWPAPTAAVGIAMLDLAYVFLGHPSGRWREIFVAASLAGAAGALIVGFFTRDLSRRAFLITTAAFTTLIWVVLAALSFGILLAPAGFLALMAASRATGRLRRATSWAIVASSAAVSLGGIAAILMLTS